MGELVALDRSTLVRKHTGLKVLGIGAMSLVSQLKYRYEFEIRLRTTTAPINTSGEDETMKTIRDT